MGLRTLVGDAGGDSFQRRRRDPLRTWTAVVERPSGRRRSGGRPRQPYPFTGPDGLTPAGLGHRASAVVYRRRRARDFSASIDLYAVWGWVTVYARWWVPAEQRPLLLRPTDGNLGVNVTHIVFDSQSLPE